VGATLTPFCARPLKYSGVVAVNSSLNQLHMGGIYGLLMWLQEKRKQSKINGTLKA
jgi:hypothetical protein